MPFAELDSRQVYYERSGAGDPVLLFLDRRGEIRAPTLVTVGDSDLLTPPYHSRAIKERVPGALLHVWSQMGHAPFWEIPDEFNELNRCFLGAH